MVPVLVVVIGKNNSGLFLDRDILLVLEDLEIRVGRLLFLRSMQDFSFISGKTEKF